MNYARNRDTFSFIIGTRNEITAINGNSLASDCDGVRLFLDGVIYNNNAEQLVSGFVSTGVDYVSQLEGSFVLFLIADSAFHIATDKVNSRKAFYTCVEGAWHIANDIDALPTTDCALSMDGLACYLANGVMFNNLTLFQDVRSAGGASIHCFKDGTHSSRRYWSYAFSCPPGLPYAEGAYQEELERLLISSVSRRYDATRGTAVSLSAGYDSRGILGILRTHAKARDILCFSYATDDRPAAYSDAALSRQLAKHCGYDHEIVKSYQRDLVAHLKNNAVEGKCLCNFCDELDAWHWLAGRQDCSDIFVGDQCFGSKVDASLETDAQVLQSVPIVGSSGIAGVETFLSQEVYAAMRECLDRLTDALIERVGPFDDPQDKWDFLYLDQRLGHVLMPWREHMTGQAGLVHNPYLDGDILDFMMGVPPEGRKGKTLFHRAVRAMFPDLFATALARSSGYSVDWGAEIARNRKALMRMVLETDSRLDDLVAREQIADMLSRCRGQAQSTAVSQRVIGCVGGRNRTVGRVLRRCFGPASTWDGGSREFVKLVLRLLLVRTYLSASSSEWRNRAEGESPTALLSAAGWRSAASQPDGPRNV